MLCVEQGARLGSERCGQCVEQPRHVLDTEPMGPEADVIAPEADDVDTQLRVVGQPEKATLVTRVEEDVAAPRQRAHFLHADRMKSGLATVNGAHRWLVMRDDGPVLEQTVEPTAPGQWRALQW